MLVVAAKGCKKGSAANCKVTNVPVKGYSAGQLVKISNGLKVKVLTIHGKTTLIKDRAGKDTPNRLIDTTHGVYRLQELQHQRPQDPERSLKDRQSVVRINAAGRKIPLAMNGAWNVNSRYDTDGQMLLKMILGLVRLNALEQE